MEGLNDSFEKLLSRYTLSSQFVEPFKFQLNKLFEIVENEGREELKGLLARKKDLESKIENLDKRYFDKPNFGDEKYNKYSLEFDMELKDVDLQIASNKKIISNHSRHIDKVIEKVTKINKYWREGDIKLSEQLTVYDNSAATNNLILPKTIYAAKFPNAFPSILNVGNLEKKISFDQYDSKGNILQYTLENGIPVSIIWGYNKTQPIAKIENAAYSQVSSYVSNLQTLSDTGTEANLITVLSHLLDNYYI